MNVDAADTAMSSNDASPSTSKLRTLRVLLANVKFALSTNAPLVPAYTTRVFVRLDITADDNVVADPVTVRPSRSIAG